MKRDMDLVRKILLRLEDHESGFAPDELAIDSYTDDQVGYHVYLMGQAGLLEVADRTGLSSRTPCALPLNLTWDGHEFIANAREETNWLQAKKVVSGAGEASFAVWKEVLTKVVTTSLGL